MSLIHWWPLNGDLTDSVGNNNLYIPDGYDKGKISINAAGKIGACYERTATETIDLLRSENKLIALTEQSICFWVYVTQHAALNTVNGLVTNHDHSTCTGLGVGLYTSNGINYYISFSAGDGTNRIHSTYYGKTDIKNNWHHICLVYDKNKKIHLYVDGIEDRDPVAYNLATKSDYFELFNWSTGYGHHSGYRPICKINDVRIYDHALSKAEIQELKKALVLHFTFNNYLKTHSYNILTKVDLNATRRNIDVINENDLCVKTTGKSEDTYFRVAVKEKLSENTQYTLYCIGQNIYDTNNETYDFVIGKMKEPPHVCIKNGYNKCDFNATNLDSRVLSPLLIDDVAYYIRGKCAATFSNLWLEHYNPNEINIDENTYITNEAGFNLGDITSSNVKYYPVNHIGNSSGYFSKNASITINMETKKLLSDEHTLSFWTFPLEEGQKMTYFANAQDRGFSYERDSNGDFIYKSCENEIIKTDKLKAEPYKWTMITIAYKANTLKLYKDGNLQETINYEIPEFSNASADLSCVLGKINTTGYEPMHGLLNDFRLYTTALNDAEIKELYDCGGRISNFGDATTGSFIEGESTIQINKNHTIDSNEIIEQDEAKASFKKNGTIFARQIIET